MSFNGQRGWNSFSFFVRSSDSFDNKVHAFTVFFTKDRCICSNQMSLFFWFASKNCYLKTTICQLWSPYVHNSPCTIINNSNIRTQICACTQLTLQMAAYTKDKLSSTFFLLQINKIQYRTYIYIYIYIYILHT